MAQVRHDLLTENQNVRIQKVLKMNDVPKVIQRKVRQFPLEKVVEKHLTTEVKKLGGKCCKFSSPNNRGVFDQIVMLDGFVYFVEVKAEKGKPSHSQQRFAKELEEQRLEWCFVYGIVGVDRFIANLTGGDYIRQSYNSPKGRTHIL